MFPNGLRTLFILFLLFASPGAHAATVWDSAADYSTTNNPNGAWQFGRKYAADGASFDVLFARWGASGTVASGGFGWYLDNWGHGGPSVLDGDGIDGPYLWAKDNSNGLPSMRWVSPATGTYQVSAQFKGADSRGVDNHVYTAINDVLIASDRVTGDLDVASFSLPRVSLASGDHIDFVLQWGGGVNSEYGWTEARALVSEVSAVPVLPALPFLVSGVVALLAMRHRRDA